MDGSAVPAAMSGLLAHQGGWDEALFVAVPIALFALLLRRANTKARRLAEAAAASADAGDPAAGDPDPVPGDATGSPTA